MGMYCRDCGRTIEEDDDRLCPRCENKNLRRELDLVNRKVAHGCTDQPCGECDRQSHWAVNRKTR